MKRFVPWKNRKNKKVYFHEFLPGENLLVILHFRTLPLAATRYVPYIQNDCCEKTNETKDKKKKSKHHLIA